MAPACSYRRVPANAYFLCAGGAAVANSTRRVAGRKSKRPSKPHADFPLYAHRAGVWAKKVRGRTRYFGNIANDPNGVAALERWLKDKDELLAGREPNANPDALTVTELVNRFLTQKAHLRDNRELNPRTFAGYYATCSTIVKTLGKGRAVVDLRPDDFRGLRVKLAETRGVVALRNEMQRVRSVFKFAFDEALIVAPVRFGQSFAKPKIEAVRREREAHRAEHGDRMLEAVELRALLARATQPMRAMIFLGINCGFGQSDLANLPIRALDLNAGWVAFPRPKTAVQRRCLLWPETIAAVHDWLSQRPEAKDEADAGLLFITKYGHRWVKLNAKGTPADALGQEFAKLLTDLDLKRPGVSFYALRHTFETIAGGCRDQVAVNHVMGHADATMAAVYRERIDDGRLVAVANHVHDWLFGVAKADRSRGRHGVARSRRRQTAQRAS
jgi:integrase